MSATLPAASDADVMNGAEIVLRALKDQGIETLPKGVEIANAHGLAATRTAIAL